MSFQDNWGLPIIVTLYCILLVILITLSWDFMRYFLIFIKYPADGWMSAQILGTLFISVIFIRITAGVSGGAHYGSGYN